MKKSLAQRIAEAWRPGITYMQLLCTLWPDEKSQRHSSNGGPPGCAMAFGAALRRMKAHWETSGEVWIPMSARKASGGGAQ